MRRPTKTVDVLISAVNVDRSRNLRRIDASTYNVLDTLVPDMAARGQQDPVTLEKIGDEYFPIRGFRRMTALQYLAANNIVNQTTGKPFKYVTAWVFEDLTDIERYELLADHGQREGLDKVELFYAFGRGFDANYDEKLITVYLRGLIQQHYPPSRKIKPVEEDKGQDLLNHYKGVLQTAKAAWKGPEILREAWIAKLEKKQNWPVKQDLFELYKVYETERSEDKTFSINRKNPGPKFMERWNSLLKKVDEAAALGERRPKSESMMNRSQVDELAKNTESWVLQMGIAFVLRKAPTDKFAEFNVLIQELESGVTPERATQIKEACIKLLGTVTPASEEAIAEVAA